MVGSLASSSHDLSRTATQNVGGGGGRQKTWKEVLLLNSNRKIITKYPMLLLRYRWYLCDRSGMASRIFSKEGTHRIRERKITTPTIGMVFFPRICVSSIVFSLYKAYGFPWKWIKIGLWSWIYSSIVSVYTRWTVFCGTLRNNYQNQSPKFVYIHLLHRCVHNCSFAIWLS